MWRPMIDRLEAKFQAHLLETRIRLLMAHRDKAGWSPAKLLQSCHNAKPRCSGESVRTSPSLPEAVCLRLERIAGARMTKDGEILLTAGNFRTQEAIVGTR